MTDDKDPKDPDVPAPPAPVDVPAVEMFADEPAPGPAPTSATAEDLRDAVLLDEADRALRKTKEDRLRELAEQREAKKREKEERKRRAAAPVEPGEPGEEDLDEDGQPRKRRGKALLVLAVTILVGGLIAALVLLGRANESRLIFRCEKDRITARQGDGFPFPWGDHGLSGPQWKPIGIPPEAECDTRETESMAELEEWFLAKLMAEAENKLLAREVTEIDKAEQELEQALLLARTSERDTVRGEIDRLLGYVEYHRGNARIEQAIETLEEAAKQFDIARDRRAKHQQDSDLRAQWARKVAQQLRGGPTGEEPEPDDEEPRPEGPRPDVTTGTALPVEPPPTAVQEPPPETPPDAGLPPAGVLL